MEITGRGSYESYNSASRIAVFQLETEGIPTRREQVIHEDGFLGYLSPLINSMRPFGLYFTRKCRVRCETTLRQDQQLVRECQDWNVARIYATIILALACFNSIRLLLIFDGNETLGATLLMKLAMVPAALTNIAFQTAYYVASHTGCLNRVFRQADLSMAELSPKYRRRAKIVTVVCWMVVAWNMSHYVYQLFTNGRLNDLFLNLLNKSLSAPYIHIVKGAFIVLQLQTFVAWIFPLAMNYMVMLFLCDQFTALNREFGACIGDRGEFNGNLKQFRRRNQAIICSVDTADRFLMISNGMGFCNGIVTIILILYSAVFYRDKTISLDPESTLVYITWLGSSVFCLALTAGQAIILNLAASIFRNSSLKSASAVNMHCQT